jgi:hypothetical protein
MMLAIADFAPDLPQNNAEGSSVNVVNLYPRTAESWAPVNSLASYSTNSLASTCLGAIVAQDTGDNVSVFAGDISSLYLLAPGNPAWQKINTGMTLPAGELWYFTQYGQAVLGAGWSQPLQTYTLNSSSAFTNLATAAPQARYITTIRDWVMVGNTFDTVNGDQPQRVQWCAINDPTTWPPEGSNAEAEVMAGSQIIPGDQGWLMGLVGNLGNADGAIFFERAIWRVIFQGSPTIFGFYPAEGVRGTPAPKSICQLGSTAFYLGEDGFYLFDGAISTPIGVGRVDKTFWNSVNTSYLQNVCGAVDPINRLIMWLYPSNASPSGVPDSMLVYNWAFNKWGFAQINAEYIFRSLTQGYSLDSLDNYDDNLDTLPFSLDSRVWSGGNIVMGAFSPAHALSFFTGAVLNTLADTVEKEIYPQTELFNQQNIAGHRALVLNTRPMIDGGTPAVQIGVRSRLIDTPTFVTASNLNLNGDCPVRAEGRYVRARITTTGTFNHLQGIQVDVKPTGLK